MSILHTINKSPYTTKTLLSCLRVCKENDSVLFLEDGVFGITSSAPCAAELQTCTKKGINIYALIDDVKARGLEGKSALNIQLIDYDSFVQLTVDHRCIQSWY